MQEKSPETLLSRPARQKITAREKRLIKKAAALGGKLPKYQKRLEVSTRKWYSPAVLPGLGAGGARMWDSG